MEYRVIIQDGAHPGLAADGIGFSSLLFDNRTNKLVGHARLILENTDVPTDLGDPRVQKGVIIGVGVLAVATGTVVVVHNRRRIKNWWQDKVIPLFARTKEEDLQGPEAEVPEELFSTATDLALAEYQANMSSKEAKQRLVALVAAAAFVAEQTRLLANAHIEDDTSSPELERAMAKLTTQQVTTMLNHMLESNTSLLDETSSAEFMRWFGGGVVIDGKYVPLRNDKIQKALRLTDDTTPSLPRTSADGAETQGDR